MNNRPHPENLGEKSCSKCFCALYKLPAIIKLQKEMIEKGDSGDRKEQTEAKCIAKTSVVSKRTVEDGEKQPNIPPIRLVHLSPAAQSRALALPSYSGVIFFSLLSASC